MTYGLADQYGLILLFLGDPKTISSYRSPRAFARWPAVRISRTRYFLALCPEPVARGSIVARR